MTITVASEQELGTAVSKYIMGGFTPVNRTSTSVMMVKRKEFSIPLGILGFLFCVVGLVIYAIVYAMQSDQVIEIRLAPRQPSSFSEDGRWWWDGNEWQDTEKVVPPGMQRSPDGLHWYDGQRWRRAPAGEPRYELPSRADNAAQGESGRGEERGPTGGP